MRGTLGSAESIDRYIEFRLTAYAVSLFYVTVKRCRIC